MASLHMDLQTALIQGLALFVIGDTLKLLVAAGILPLGWKLTGRANDDHPGKVGTRGE
jgi:biotin transport system substrate-specific component